MVLEGTATISPCAWATGWLHSPGPGVSGWLDGFDDLSAECEGALFQLPSQPVRYLAAGPGGVADQAGQVQDPPFPGADRAAQGRRPEGRSKPECPSLYEDVPRATT